MKLLQILLLFILSTVSIIAYGAKLPRAEDVIVPTIPAQGYEAPYLLLNCGDFRLRYEVEKFMVNRGLLNKYDDIALPGAAMGIDNPKMLEWQQTFIEALGALKKLHKLKNVIIIDHKDCGMYNLVYGRDITKDPKEELKIHRKHLLSAKKNIQKVHPDLKVELLIMDIQNSDHVVKVHTIDKLS